MWRSSGSLTSYSATLPVHLPDNSLNVPHPLGLRARCHHTGLGGSLRNCTGTVQTSRSSGDVAVSGFLRMVLSSGAGQGWLGGELGKELGEDL